MKPNILWLYSDRTGCGSYRCYIPGLVLQELGYDNHFTQHKELMKVRPDPNEFTDMHLAVFQRAVSPRFLMWAEECQRRGIPMVWEADDDVFNIPRNNPSAPFWVNRDTQRLLREILKMVDHVTVSTAPLRDSFISEAGVDPSMITVAPNFIHPDIWGPQVVSNARFTNSVTKADGLTPYTVIGWQGSATHDSDFRMALPALKQIIAERPDVILRFFGNVPMSLRGVIPEYRFQFAKGVEFERYPAQLAYMNFDIGIAPITDSRFNRCKSNLKWLEYSALGIPCVASKVYPYERHIEHGVTGFVAANDEDWYRYLTALLDSPELRQTIGRQAKQTVWSQHSISRISAWDSVFRRLLEQAYGEQLVSRLMGVERLGPLDAFSSPRDQRPGVPVHEPGAAVSPACAEP